MTKTFNEQFASRLLKDNLLWDIAGIENGILNGENTEEDLEKMMDARNLLDMADSYLTESYKEGYLSSHKTDMILEAKHLKFLGKEKLEDIKMMAVALTIFECHK